MSKYSLSWLAENSYEENTRSLIQPRILWNADIYNNANVPSAKWETFMSSDDELKKFLQNYLLYGIAFVDDVPTTVEATEAVTERVSLIRYKVLLVPELQWNSVPLQETLTGLQGNAQDIRPYPLNPNPLLFCVFLIHKGDYIWKNVVFYLRFFQRRHGLQPAGSGPSHWHFIFSGTIWVGGLQETWTLKQPQYNGNERIIYRTR